jgi:hypothetical protein
VLLIVGLLGAVALIALLPWTRHEPRVAEQPRAEVVGPQQSDVLQASDASTESARAPAPAESEVTTIELPTDLAGYRDFSLQYVDLATWEAYLAKAVELGYDAEAIHSGSPDVQFESLAEGERFIRMTEQSMADNTRPEDRLDRAMRIFPGNERLDPDVRNDRILNPEGKALDDDQVADLLELDRPDRDQVRQLVEENAWDMYRLVMTQAFDRGLYTAMPVPRAPGAVLVRPSLGRMKHYQTVISYSSWTFGIQIFAGEIPELDELIAILDPLRLRREERLRAAIAAM